MSSILRSRRCVMRYTTSRYPEQGAGGADRRAVHSTSDSFLRNHRLQGREKAFWSCSIVVKGLFLSAALGSQQCQHFPKIVLGSRNLLSHILLVLSRQQETFKLNKQPPPPPKPNRAERGCIATSTAKQHTGGGWGGVGCYDFRFFSCLISMSHFKY